METTTGNTTAIIRELLDDYGRDKLYDVDRKVDIDIALQRLLKKSSTRALMLIRNIEGYTITEIALEYQRAENDIKEELIAAYLELSEELRVNDYTLQKYIKRDEFYKERKRRLEAFLKYYSERIERLEEISNDFKNEYR